MTTVETILTEIAKLAPDEQEQLRQQLNAQARYERNGQTAVAQNGQPATVKKEPRGPFPEPIPVPNEGEAMRWLNDHWRAYPEEWVALDGYHLIAHDCDFRKVRGLSAINHFHRTGAGKPLRPGLSRV